MKILVSGGAGFVGRPAVAALLRRGHEVILAVSRRRPPPAPGLQFIPADLSSPEDRRRLWAEAGAEAFLHLAWPVPPEDFWVSAENLAWVGHSLDLIRGFAEAGGRRLLAAGTGAEYDWRPGGRLDERTSVLAPRSLYGVCKNAVREVAAAYAARSGLSFAWGRLFWLYGPGEAAGRLLPSLAAALRQGRRFLCRGGNLRRDYLRVEDAGSALAALLLSDLEGAVNIGSGEAVSLARLTSLAAEALGRLDLLDISRAEPDADNPESLYAGLGRLKGELGWRPAVGLAEGLEDFGAPPPLTLE